MSFHKKILLGILSLGALSSSFAQEAWDWNRCLQHAAENNIQLKLDQINIQLAELQAKQDRLNLTPFIQADAGYTYAIGRTVDMSTYQYVTKPVNTGNMQVSLNQPIFEGLKNIHAVKKSKLDLQAARLDHEVLQQSIQLQVMNAYLNVLNAQEQYLQAQEQLKRSQEQYQNSKNLVDAGALAEKAIVDIEAQLSSDEYNVALLQQQVELAYMALKTVLQLDQSRDIVVVTPPIAEDLDVFNLESIETVYQSALGHRPEIASSKLKVESANKGVKMAKSAYMPKLSFFSAAGSNLSDQFTEVISTDNIETPVGYVKSTGEAVYTLYPVPKYSTMKFGSQFTNNLSFALGLNLSIPIYNRRAGYLSTQQAKLSLVQSQLNEENTSFTLYNNIKEAHIKASTSEQNYKAASKNLDAANRSMEYAQERWTNGAINQLELNLAQNNLLVAQSRWTQAKYEYIFNVKVLDFYYGKKIDF